MDERQLAVLRELGDRGSVVAVARALGVTSSAVSQHLTALQRSSPVPLTQRNGRALGLTEAGRALATAAVGVADALARARNAVTDFVADPHTTLRLAAFHSAARAFFPPLLMCLQSVPGPWLELHDRDVPQEDFPRLTADYDLVIAHRAAHSQPWPRSVRAMTLLHEPLDIAVPANHRLAALPQVRVNDVADETWISVHDGFPLIGSVEAIAALADRPLRIAHRINDFSVAAALVGAGAGLALLPRYTANHDLGPDVVLRPLSDLRPARRVDVLMRPEHASRSAVCVVVDALAATATALVKASGNVAGAGPSSRSILPR
jgi:DNA-binding transcriptional LysR family regulator